MNGSATATTSLAPEMMLNCTDAGMTVLERQRARFRWQHLPHQLEEEEEEAMANGYYGNHSDVILGQHLGGGGGLLGEVVTRSWKPNADHDHHGGGLVGNGGWPDLAGPGCGYASCNTSNYNNISESSFNYTGNAKSKSGNGLGFELNYAVSGTSSSPTALVAVPPPEEMVPGVGVGVGVGREVSKKRKADKVGGEEDCRDKRGKGGCGEDGESKITDKSSNHKSGSNNNNKKGNNNNNNNNNLKKENSAETSKDNNSKVTDVQKPDYIHVRARRGQATDSHSLAERVRREKISERMKYLQDLVPGCNKITGKAGMLDEIINYVQSLQRQVEFLSMKLAAVNPRIDFNVDNLYPKEGFPPCLTNFPAVGMSPDVTNTAYLQLSPLQQQIVTCCGLDVGISPPDLGLRRTISAPMAMPEAFVDSTCFNQLQPTTAWDADLQNLYNVAFDQGRSTSFTTQPAFTGPIDAGTLKMEM